MSNPLTRAFFIGRATAEAIIEQLEDTLTDALSALGKFDAEQREKLRNFLWTIYYKVVKQFNTRKLVYTFFFNKLIAHFKCIQIYKKNFKVLLFVLIILEIVYATIYRRYTIYTFGQIIYNNKFK